MSTLPDNATAETGHFPVAMPGSTVSNPRVKRWNREEYYRLGDQGWFHDQRVELIEGQILIKHPPPDFSDVSPLVKRWSRSEYHRLAELGWFQKERVELIDGEILVLTPQSSWHAYALDKTTELLHSVFSSDHWVRLQLPLVMEEYGEPEPDISVVQGARENFIDRHPTSAALIVEISYSTQDYDTKTKAHLYASMGVPDYWVLDLENRQLLVHRVPVKDDNAPFGHRYQQVETLPADGHVSPLEKADAKLSVVDMLPPKK